MVVVVISVIECTTKKNIFHGVKFDQTAWNWSRSYEIGRDFYELDHNFLLFVVSGLEDKEMFNFAPPLLISEPSQMVLLNKGDNYTLKCHARGEPAPRFTWYKEKEPGTSVFYFLLIWQYQCFEVSEKKKLVLDQASASKWSLFFCHLIKVV